MLLLFATPVTSPFFPFSRLDRLAQVVVVLIKSCTTCLELSPKVFVSNAIIDLLPFRQKFNASSSKGPCENWPTLFLYCSLCRRRKEWFRSVSDPPRITRRRRSAGQPVPAQGFQASRFGVNVVEVRASANRGQRLQSVLITQFGSSCNLDKREPASMQHAYEHT